MYLGPKRHYALQQMFLLAHTIFFLSSQYGILGRNVTDSELAAFLEEQVPKLFFVPKQLITNKIQMQRKRTRGDALCSVRFVFSNGWTQNNNFVVIEYRKDKRGLGSIYQMPNHETVFLVHEQLMTNKIKLKTETKYRLRCSLVWWTSWPL